MRIISREVYRAFPELDSFDDAMCRQFVRAVTQRWRAQILRFLAVGVVVALSLVVMFLIQVQVIDRVTATDTRLRPMPDWMAVLIGIVTMGGMLLIGFTLALIVRDQTLRRQVRRVIQKRGTCVRCSYSLLGMPVGDDLKVVCPECGLTTTVDPALGELAPGADGAGRAVYRPVAPVIDVERSKRRWKMVRKGLKWTGAGALVVLAGACLVALVVFLQLHSERRKAQAVLKGNTVESQAWTDAALDAERRFGQPLRTDVDVLGTLEAFVQTELRLRVPNSSMTIEEYMRSERRAEYWRVFLDPIERGMWAGSSVPMKGSAGGEDEEMRAFVRTMQATPEAKALDVLADSLPWMMPKKQDSSGDMENQLLVRRMMLQASSEFGVASMAVAREDARWDEFARSLKISLASSEMGASSFWASWMMWQRMRAARIAAKITLEADTTEWWAAVQRTLVRHVESPNIAPAIEVQVAEYRNTVAKGYAEMKDVIAARYISRMRRIPPMMQDASFQLSFDEHMAEFDSVRSMLLQNASKRASERPKQGNTTRSLYANIVERVGLSMLDTRDFSDLEVRSSILLIAIHRYHLRTGAWPERLADLAVEDLGVDAGKLLDPFSGKSFGYLRIDPDQDPERRSFILYSVGPDGADGGAKLPADPRAVAARIPPMQGSDLIMNPVPDRPQVAPQQSPVVPEPK